MSASSQPSFSKRIASTDTPCIVQMQEMMRGRSDMVSLAQGVVHWEPPPSALERAKEATYQKRTHGYGPDDGLPELRAALREKISIENGLTESDVMVTAGANQACVNVVLAVCDPSDAVVLFVPYYFNHHMSLQMTGVTDIRFGPTNPDTLFPDADWLEQELSDDSKAKPKLVVVTTPCNPTGAVIPGDLLERISAVCQRAGVWLMVDNTYDYFVYDGHKHCCVEGPHVVNIFSFSKAYGMMGWRVGYIAYPKNVESMGAQLLKAQDTIVVCPSIIGQQVALAALETAGASWVAGHVQGLESNRKLALAALAPLGEDAVKGGQGAIYLWAKLPERVKDDKEVVKWLGQKHGVSIIPGSACGAPGYIRVAYSNLVEEDCRKATKRLRVGLTELVERGLVQ